MGELELGLSFVELELAELEPGLLLVELELSMIFRLV
jgi:hypothetical protein